MLPAVNGFLNQDFTVVEQPSNTFYWNTDQNRIFGNIDGAEAMRQAIYLIIQTERYRYVIYSRNYGIELLDLFGQPMTFVIPEVKHRIEEALLWDTRITSLENFDSQPNKGALSVSFTAVTIFGEIPITQEYEGLNA